MTKQYQTWPHYTVSTEMFDGGFLYFFVGKVWGTKNDMEVDLKENKTPILIGSCIKMKHYSDFWGPRASGIDSEHASVISLDVLGDGLF